VLTPAELLAVRLYSMILLPEYSHFRVFECPQVALQQHRGAAFTTPAPHNYLGLRIAEALK